MTTRRGFLAQLGALAAAVVVVPAQALATVQRLGTPEEWVGPVTTSPTSLNLLRRKVQGSLLLPFDYVCEEYTLIGNRVEIDTRCPNCGAAHPAGAVECAYCRGSFAASEWSGLSVESFKAGVLGWAHTATLHGITNVPGGGQEP